MPIEDLAEESLAKNPNLELAQHLFTLTTESRNDDAKLTKLLMESIKDNNMAPFYEQVCSTLNKPIDNQLLEHMRAENQKQLKKLEEAIEDANKNLGEMEVREANLAKAEYLSLIGDKESALEAFKVTYDKTVSLGHRLDLLFHIIRIGLFYLDHDLISQNIEKAKTLIEEGGDWDRRNRLRVYQGLYCLAIRDFKTAAQLFLDTVSTFTCYELCDYKTFVTYTVLCSLISLERVDLREKVIKGAEILEVLHSVPNIQELLFSLFDRRYTDFFHSLTLVGDFVENDRFLSPHCEYFICEMKINAYNDLLESCSNSTTLQNMANTFGIPTSHLETDLTKFIAAGRLDYKIDKENGIVESNRFDTKSDDSNDKQEDSLLIRIVNEVFEKRKNNIFDLEAYMFTSFILDNNSDFHVMWNFRREILLNWKTVGMVSDILKTKNLKSREVFKGYDDYELFSILDSVQVSLTKSDHIDLDKIFLAELVFTSKCLTRHLKSYATWHHRTQIIKWMSKPPLESELDECGDLFTLDPRNFHCWNYRKFICELLYGSNGGMTNQLLFIKSMIKKNPDNFSAFHYQSVLLDQLKERGLLGGDASSLEYQKIWNDEFNAMKPSLLNIASLQGLWIYFWWLCLMRFDLQKSSKSTNPIIHRLILDNENRILVYQFNQCLRVKPFNEITLISTSGSTFNHPINCWQSIGPLTSDLWYHQIADSVDCENISEIMFTYSGETQLIKMPPLNQSNLSVSTINELPKSKFDLIRQTQSTDWINDICEQSNDSQVIMETNRYFILTKALISGESCANSIAIDPLRLNFYTDLQSRHLIEEKLQNNHLEPQLNLQNLSLTCIHPISHLTHLRSLDLSVNQLTRINGSFNSLISLTSLILDDNHISLIDPSFKMISLQKLSLKNNRLVEKSSIKSCNNCEKLKLIIITGNLIANQIDLQLEPRCTIEN